MNKFANWIRIFLYRARASSRKILHAMGVDIIRFQPHTELLKLQGIHNALIQLRDLRSTPDIADEVAFIRVCHAHLENSKAQSFQDLFVLYSLDEKKNGFFVEFGSTNGVAISNTFLLENEYQWRGILAEPARCWQDLLKANRNCHIDHRCVWKASGLSLEFNEVNDPELSTINQFSNFDNRFEARKQGKKYLVDTISLSDLLDFHDAPRSIDFLSIDTEGSEYEILSAFDFDKYDIGIITVEHNYTVMRQKIYDLLTSKGYARKFDKISQQDDWYVRET
jgi:FkbM family methyltransferase